ncbi:hypothetical protein [Rahnella sp. Larv3_ips]|uniref:hypothetical protein n=1 Tax=Rahnella sp. Larv3_ips TaxID=1896943 RepID=UPI000EFACC69|nr:hypothetical protein [Rahnella sp. Larv3_ips]
MTEIALHRTRLRFLRRYFFSVLKFYKPHRQPAPYLGFCRHYQTEKIEKNFSKFKFSESPKDRRKIKGD